MEQIKEIIQESIAVKQKLLENGPLLEQLQELAELVAGGYQNDQKVLFCGNGGSAADAQHIAAELSGRFYMDREPLYAEALHCNTSYLTAVANDYSYGEIYSRLVKGMGHKGDILFCISTSGNSENIVKAAEMGKEMGLFTVALTGESGGKLADICHYLLNVPSNDTPRIQECHILLGHILCQLVEGQMFGE